MGPEPQQTRNLSRDTFLEQVGAGEGDACLKSRILLSPSNNELSILEDLGLTFSKAKVYIALVKLGHPSPAMEIAEAAGVARQDNYRILRLLQEIGLVEKALGSPNVFKPTPWQEALSLLWEAKKAEHAQLQDQVKSLIRQRLPIADSCSSSDYLF